MDFTRLIYFPQIHVLLHTQKFHLCFRSIILVGKWMGCKGSVSCLRAYTACVCVRTHRRLCSCARTHKKDPRKKIITSQGYSWLSVTGNYVRAGGGWVKKNQDCGFHQRRGFLVHQELQCKILLGTGQTSANSPNCSLLGLFNTYHFQWLLSYPFYCTSLVPESSFLEVPQHCYC